MENNVERSRRIIVVGASSGMGAEVVRRLSARGDRVAGLDLSGARWPEDLNVEARIGIDVSSPESVVNAVDAAIQTLGHVDALINCAGVLGPVKPLTEITFDEVGKLISINLQGAFNLTREAVKHMEPRGFGRIVHIASMAGKEGNPGMAAYSATKAGVIGMVKAVAKEVAQSGVTINAIAPASIDTPLIQGMTPERQEVQKALIPMGRFGTVAEVAALVEFIISEDASFTTGFVYDMSGGRAVY